MQILNLNFGRSDSSEGATQVTSFANLLTNNLVKFVKIDGSLKGSKSNHGFAGLCVHFPLYFSIKI